MFLEQRRKDKIKCCDDGTPSFYRAQFIFSWNRNKKFYTLSDQAMPSDGADRYNESKTFLLIT